MAQKRYKRGRKPLSEDEVSEFKYTALENRMKKLGVDKFILRVNKKQNKSNGGKKV